MNHMSLILNLRKSAVELGRIRRCLALRTRIKIFAKKPNAANACRITSTKGQKWKNFSIISILNRPTKASTSKVENSTVEPPWNSPISHGENFKGKGRREGRAP